MAAASTELARLDATPAAAALLTTPVAGLPAEVRAPVVAAQFLAQYAGHTQAAYRRLDSPAVSPAVQRGEPLGRLVPPAACWPIRHGRVW